MCWILVSKAGNPINEEYMDKAQKHNEDGYGVAWYENGFVNTYKTFDYDKFKGVCKALEDYTLVIHLRYATKGDKSYANIHPFDIPTGVMFHNGTMYKAPKEHNGSDSAGLANLISQCTFESISDIQPLIEPYVDDKINRLVFFEDDGQITIINEHLGIEDSNGDWYSNDYHLKDKGWCRTGCSTKVKSNGNTKKVKSTDIPIEYHKPQTKKEDTVIVQDKRDNFVFVYGTLKTGDRNHRLLKDAIFLGEAHTLDKWTMVGESLPFPYVLERHRVLGKHIQGEVYAVNKAELARLDMLEGVPTHYKKETVSVVYDVDGIEEEVIMYVKSFVDTGYRNNPNIKLINKWEVKNAKV